MREPDIFHNTLNMNNVVRLNKNKRMDPVQNYFALFVMNIWADLHGLCIYSFIYSLKSPFIYLFKHSFSYSIHSIFLSLLTEKNFNNSCHVCAILALVSVYNKCIRARGDICVLNLSVRCAWFEHWTSVLGMWMWIFHFKGNINSVAVSVGCS